MSAATSNSPGLEPEVHEYLKVWSENMGQVLTQIAGAPFTMESVLAPPPETPAPEEHDLQASVAAAGSLSGEMSLRVPRAVVLAVGQLFLQESQDAAAELKPDHLDALQELLRQAAGQVATALSARWDKTQLRVEAGAAPTWAAGARLAGLSRRGSQPSADGMAVEFRVGRGTSSCPGKAARKRTSKGRCARFQPARPADGCGAGRDPAFRKKEHAAAGGPGAGRRFGGRAGPPGAGTRRLAPGRQIDCPRGSRCTGWQLRLTSA